MEVMIVFIIVCIYAVHGGWVCAKLNENKTKKKKKKKTFGVKIPNKEI